MKLTSRGELALQAMIELARREPGLNSGTSAAELARRCHASARFLEQVLDDLQAGGFVISTRGRFGGRRLARPAGEISVGQINRYMDGPLAPAPCASVTSHRACDWCPNEAECDLKPVWSRVRDAVSQVMDSISLQDVVDESANRHAGRYVI
jgi:Rrf2 family protein